jgi:hypothetical protein
LEAALADVFVHGPGGPEWAEGLISLLYKGRGCRAELASYRPITLLNCDLKLVGKVVAERMQAPLDCLIDPCQTAFIKGRWIGDNVLTRQSLIEHLERSGQPGALVFLDIAKAYDRVNRGWLMRCAEATGLPAGLRVWMGRLMEGCTACVRVNGWVSGAFPVDNGLPQGGPAAPCFWVLQLEPLTAALRRAQEQGALRAPLMPGGVQAPPVFHHADDTQLALQDFSTDGAAALPILERFCKASGARINPDKSKGVCLGGHGRIVGASSVALHGGMDGVDFGESGADPPVSLGVPCTADAAFFFCGSHVTA